MRRSEHAHALCWEAPRGPEELRAAAELIYQSFAEYYDLFTLGQGAIVDALVPQMEEPCSEVGQPKVLRAGGAIVGLYCWYFSEEMEQRQLASLHMLVHVAQATPEVFARLREYREQVNPVADGACYLSRIAVHPAYRRAGHGRRLLAAFEHEAVRRGRTTAALHVRGDNEAAMRFYVAAGYALVSPPHLRYHTMQKAVA